MKEVSYIVFETEMARLERIIKRQFVLIIIALVLLIGTNACWMWYESQLEEVTTTTKEITQDVSQDSEDGNNTFIGGDNVEAESKTDGEDNDR